MELHLHLTVAFQALDRKWGPAIDLDCFEESRKCVPAVLDTQTTTFSSEEFLRRRRPKPYYKVENKRQAKKTNNSETDISRLNIPSEAYSDDLSMDNDKTFAISKENCEMSQSHDKFIEKCSKFIGKEPVKNIFKNMKDGVKSYVHTKSWIKGRNYKSVNPY